jgi:hypothetical protein
VVVRGNFFSSTIFSLSFPPYYRYRLGSDRILPHTTRAMDVAVGIDGGEGGGMFAEAVQLSAERFLGKA